MAKEVPQWLIERRARRAERREKQRIANIGRAEKFHAARLAFEQKPTAPPSVPPAKPAAFRRKYHVGCSGWYYWHWHELFYPADIPRKAWFDFYASQFDTVELNAPFYAWPTVATVQSWLKQAGESNMIYTVKVCELISHVKRFARTAELVKDFSHIADLLGPRMGCFLFQLPPSFHYSADRLKRIVAQLDQRRRNVVEFRHRSWWNDHVYEAFRDAGVIFCSCSGPRLPDELVKTADDIYVRFHGLKNWYRHDYSDEELKVWADRIKASKAKRVWAYFNNDRQGFAIKNARRLLRRLRQR
jgi:uncharacterized protein YecE (DUF72 family)